MRGRLALSRRRRASSWAAASPLLRLAEKHPLAGRAAGARPPGRRRGGAAPAPRLAEIPALAGGAAETEHRGVGLFGLDALDAHGNLERIGKSRDGADDRRAFRI